jgi:hypothetical protein
MACEHVAPHVIEALRPLGDVALIDHLLFNCQMNQPIREGEVGARRELQVQRCGSGGIGIARVHHNQMSAPVLLLEDRLHDGGHRLRAVRAPEHERVRLRDVGDRKRESPVDAERAFLAGSGRRHAVPTVIVEFGDRSTTRTNLPNKYAFSLVRAPLPKAARADDPWSARRDKIRSATKSSAVSQSTAARRPSRCRSIGLRIRAG